MCTWKVHARVSGQPTWEVLNSGIQPFSIITVLHPASVVKVKVSSGTKFNLGEFDTRAPSNHKNNTWYWHVPCFIHVFHKPQATSHKPQATVQGRPRPPPGLPSVRRGGARAGRARLQAPHLSTPTTLHPAAASDLSNNPRWLLRMHFLSYVSSTVSAENPGDAHVHPPPATHGVAVMARGAPHHRQVDSMLRPVTLRFNASRGNHVRGPTSDQNLHLAMQTTCCVCSNNPAGCVLGCWFVGLLVSPLVRRLPFKLPLVRYFHGSINSSFRCWLVPCLVKSFVRSMCLFSGLWIVK